jgi:hypothetical protein
MEVLYEILIEFCLLMNRVIKMCLNETCSKVCLVEQVSDTFLIQNGLKQGYILLPFFSFAIRKDKENR